MDVIIFKLTQRTPRKTKTTSSQKDNCGKKKKDNCGSQRTNVTDGASPEEKADRLTNVGQRPTERD